MQLQRRSETFDNMWTDENPKAYDSYEKWKTENVLMCIICCITQTHHYECQCILEYICVFVCLVVEKIAKNKTTNRICSTSNFSDVLLLFQNWFVIANEFTLSEHLNQLYHEQRKFLKNRLSKYHKNGIEYNIFICLLSELVISKQNHSI